MNHCNDKAPHFAGFCHCSQKGYCRTWLDETGSSLPDPAPGSASVFRNILFAVSEDLAKLKLSKPGPFIWFFASA
jgi:hypothetical protein